MDAIALLKADHDKVKGLLAELESTTERGVKTRTELFATIKGELTVHEIIEEEIFYPELKAHPKAKDIVLEGFEEHHVVDLLMGELEALDVTDESWGAKALVMKENVEHHIEEEEGEMFKTARQVFDRDELVDLGDRMAARKEFCEGRARRRLTSGRRRTEAPATSIHIGTSGFLYEHWRGRFYPPDARGAELEFYAERFDTVELNVTFYRMPTAATFRAWARRVPDRLRLCRQGKPLSDPRAATPRAQRARRVPHGSCRRAGRPSRSGPAPAPTGHAG